MKERINKFILKNLFGVISLSIAILSITFSVYYVFYNDCPVCEECPEIECEADNKEIVTNKIRVDVKGAVKKPGVYELDENSIIEDAIKLSGGISTNGVTTNINLSKRLTDQMVIYVFNKSEIKEKETSNEVICEIPKCECETITITPEYPESSNNITSTNTSNATTNTSGKVSINTASIEELMTLDGIGESKAKSIIAYRNENGNFENLEDIKNVSGIGDAAYEKIKDNITL